MVLMHVQHEKNCYFEINLAGSVRVDDEMVPKGLVRVPPSSKDDGLVRRNKSVIRKWHGGLAVLVEVGPEARLSAAFDVQQLRRYRKRRLLIAVGREVGAKWCNAVCVRRTLPEQVQQLRRACVRPVQTYQPSPAMHVLEGKLLVSFSLQVATALVDLVLPPCHAVACPICGSGSGSTPSPRKGCPCFSLGRTARVKSNKTTSLCGVG